MTRSGSIRAALTAGLVAGGLLLPAAVAPAVAGDAKGPPCADYIVGDGAGEGYAETTVVVRNVLAKTACPKITYTLVVLTGDGATELGRSALPGDPSWSFNGIPVAQWSLDVGVNEASICYYLTTSSDRGRLIDRAPDTGCAVILQGTAPAGRGHN